MKKPRVLLDTNMLMLFGKGVNIFDQIEELLISKPEFYVIKPVVDELKKIAEKGRVKDKRVAKLALQAVEKYCRIIDIDVKQGMKVDDLIVEVASREKFVVATNDKELRRRLREKGIPEIYYREEKHLLEVQGVF